MHDDPCHRCGSEDDCLPDCPMRLCDHCGGSGLVVDLTRPIPEPERPDDGGLWYWTARCPAGCEPVGPARRIEPPA